MSNVHVFESEHGDANLCTTKQIEEELRRLCGNENIQCSYSLLPPEPAEQFRGKLTILLGTTPDQDTYGSEIAWVGFVPECPLPPMETIAAELAAILQLTSGSPQQTSGS